MKDNYFWYFNICATKESELVNYKLPDIQLTLVTEGASKEASEDELDSDLGPAPSSPPGPDPTVFGFPAREDPATMELRAITGSRKTPIPSAGWCAFGKMERSRVLWDEGVGGP